MIDQRQLKPPLGVISELRSPLDYVATPIPRFISMKVGSVDMLVRPLAPFGHRAFVSVVRMEMVIHMAAEVGGAMEPRANTNKDSARKPLRPVVAVWSASIRRGVVVPVRTLGRGSNVDGNLSLHFRSIHCESCHR